MHISISGKLSSGKSTVSKYLQEKNGFQVYSAGKIQRETAKKLGLTILELNKLQQVDKKYDEVLDDNLKQVALEKQSEDIIFDSRIAFKLLDKTFKVYVTVDPLEAANRVMGDTERGKVEQYTTVEEALSQLEAREDNEITKFKALYDVDISDLNNYDLVVDSTYFSPEEVAESVLENVTGVVNWDNTTNVILSPKSLYPTDRREHINFGTVKGYAAQVEKGEELLPIKVYYFRGHYYVIDGHHRLLAYLMNNTTKIKCQLVKNEDSKLTDPNILKTELSYVGLSTVYDFEDAGHFKYKSYPNLYS